MPRKKLYKWHFLAVSEEFSIDEKVSGVRRLNQLNRMVFKEKRRLLRNYRADKKNPYPSPLKVSINPI